MCFNLKRSKTGEWLLLKNKQPKNSTYTHTHTTATYRCLKFIILLTTLSLTLCLTAHQNQLVSLTGTCNHTVYPPYFCLRPSISTQWHLISDYKLRIFLSQIQTSITFAAILLSRIEILIICD